MSLSHRYPDFGDLSFPMPPPSPITADALEELRLTTFEEGYSAGWDDAIRAHETDQSRAIAEISETWQEMSFTYHEAFAKLMVAIKPLLSDIVTIVLPKIKQAALAPQVEHEIAALIEKNVENAIEIAVSPQSEEAVRAALEGSIASPISLTTDPEITNGQAFLRVNKSEREINLDAICSTVIDAMAAFQETAGKEMTHD